MPNALKTDAAQRRFRDFRSPSKVVSSSSESVSEEKPSHDHSDKREENSKESQESQKSKENSLETKPKESEEHQKSDENEKDDKNNDAAVMQLLGKPKSKLEP